MAVKRSDVARLAGTSPAVVSYVLNNGPRRVAPATRDRVLAAAEALGYRPNMIASSLRTNRSMTLGLVVPDAANPYFAELARALEDEAFARGYTLIMGNATDDRDRELSYVRAFVDRRVDGVMLLPSGGNVAGAEELDRTGTPWVVLDRDFTGSHALARVLSDNGGGARTATRHLLDHGRTRIACVSGPAGAASTADRVEGWRSALTEAGAMAGGVLSRQVPFEKFAARDATVEILTNFPKTDGIFVSSDEQAIGVLKALAEMGLKCPEDVAVVSFDGTAVALMTIPGLSTIRQPREEIARLAIATLCDRDRDAQLHPAEAPTVLPVELVRRGSCGCPEPEADP